MTMTMPSSQLLDRIFESDPSTLQFNGEHAAKAYADLGIDRHDLFEHACRTEALVRSFAGDAIPEQAIQMVWVHDVFDRFWNTDSPKYTLERYEAAKYVLLDMLTERRYTEEQINYCLSILHDMVEAERASGEHRTEMARMAALGGEHQGLDIVSMLSNGYKGTIPAEAWQAAEPYIMFEYMDSFLRDTNIESLGIKACELLDNMRHPSSRRESAMLQDVLEAESFYAPILEVIGFDGLASSLRGVSHVIRLEKSGRSDLVEQSREILGNIREVGIDTIAFGVFGEWKRGGYINSVAVDTQTGEIPVIVGDGVIINNNGTADIKYRVKTEGSLASKLDKYEGTEPKDIVGFTVISDDITTSARNFADFITERMPYLGGTVAKGKSEPFFVQGSVEYVEAVRAGLRAKGICEEIIQFEPQTAKEVEKDGQRKLEVAKATVLMDSIPVEVQFLTRDERQEARKGEVAHIIYKYFESFKKIGKELSADEKRTIIAKAKKVLEMMHARKYDLNKDSLMVNGRSSDGGLSVGVALAA